MSPTSSTPASPALQTLRGGSTKNSKNKQVSFGSNDGKPLQCEYFFIGDEQICESSEVPEFVDCSLPSKQHAQLPQSDHVHVSLLPKPMNVLSHCVQEGLQDMIMSALRDRAAQILKEPGQPQERKKVLDKPQMAEARWKRLILAVMLIFKNMRNELVMDYLTQRQEIDLPDFEDDRKKRVKSQSADPTQWKVRMGIGKPLSRSVAQKSWQRDPDSCPHPEDQLWHRAGRGHFWYTCLGCGSRWERLQLPEDPAASSSSSTQIVKTPPRKSTQGYPKKLPAPRYRPDLGNYRINVKTQEEKGSPAMLTQGPIPPLPRRSMEEMTGLVPTRRSKSPTRSGQAQDPEQFLLMDPQEWEDAMMDYQEALDQQLESIHGPDFTERDRENFMDT